MLGELIGAASNIIGGLFGNSEAKKNRKLQKDAMTKRIQWTVADANAAGVNPLYALGAPTFSPSPIMSGMGDSIAAAGQNIGRAVDSAADPGERLGSIDQAARKLQLENMALQNAKLASEIRLTQQAGTPPALPGGAKSIIAGQGDARIATDPDSAPLSLVLPRTDDSGKDRWVAGRATNSQTIADMYGDAAQELYGMARLGIDAYRNLVKPYVDPALKAAAQRVLEADRALPPLPKRRRFVGRYGGR